MTQHIYNMRFMRLACLDNLPDGWSKHSESSEKIVLVGPDNQVMHVNFDGDQATIVKVEQGVPANTRVVDLGNVESVALDFMTRKAAEEKMPPEWFQPPEEEGKKEKPIEKAPEEVAPRWEKPTEEWTEEDWKEEEKLVEKEKPEEVEEEVKPEKEPEPIHFGVLTLLGDLNTLGFDISTLDQFRYIVSFMKDPREYNRWIMLTSDDEYDRIRDNVLEQPAKVSMRMVAQIDPVAFELLKTLDDVGFRTDKRDIVLELLKEVKVMPERWSALIAVSDADWKHLHDVLVMQSTTGGHGYQKSGPEIKGDEVMADLFRDYSDVFSDEETKKPKKVRKAPEEEEPSLQPSAPLPSVPQPSISSPEDLEKQLEDLEKQIKGATSPEEVEAIGIKYDSIMDFISQAQKGVGKVPEAKEESSPLNLPPSNVAYRFKPSKIKSYHPERKACSTARLFMSSSDINHAITEVTKKLSEPNLSPNERKSLTNRRRRLIGASPQMSTEEKMWYQFQNYESKGPMNVPSDVDIWPPGTDTGITLMHPRSGMMAVKTGMFLRNNDPERKNKDGMVVKRYGDALLVETLAVKKNEELGGHVHQVETWYPLVEVRDSTCPKCDNRLEGMSKALESGVEEIKCSDCGTVSPISKLPLRSYIEISQNSPREPASEKQEKIVECIEFDESESEETAGDVLKMSMRYVSQDIQLPQLPQLSQDVQQSVTQNVQQPLDINTLKPGDLIESSGGSTDMGGEVVKVVPQGVVYKDQSGAEVLKPSDQLGDVKIIKQEVPGMGVS